VVVKRSNFRRSKASGCKIDQEIEIIAKFKVNESMIIKIDQEIEIAVGALGGH
jgi:hypothetical protein